MIITMMFLKSPRFCLFFFFNACTSALGLFIKSFFEICDDARKRMVKQTRKRKLNASRESEIDEGYVDGTFYRVVHSLCCLISSLSSRRFWRHLLPSFAYFFGPFTSFFSKKSSSLVAREKISDIDGTTTRPMCSCRSIDLVEALYKWRRCDTTTTTTTTGRRRGREFFPFLSLSHLWYF